MTGVYLDHNATAPVLPEAARAMAEALAPGAVGNPSSVHAFGRRARARLEDSREAVAALVGARPDQVIFTSGGTESAALALSGLGGGGAVLISSVEHACIREAAPDAEPLPVTAHGVLDLDALEARLANGPAPALLAVMLANNETGVIQPVAQAAAALRAAVPDALLVCDAVQGPGKLAVDFNALDADALLLSAHKMGGPQGVGALVIRRPDRLAPLVRGGGQERGRRGGTPNLPGIIGFGAACAVVMAAGEAPRAAMGTLRDRLEDGIRARCPDAVIWGAGVPRLPNTTCVGLPGVDQQRQIMALDLAGVAVSAGSACSSGKVAPSAVLTAMGATPTQAREAIRVSLGPTTTAAEVDAFLEAWERLVPHALAPRPDTPTPRPGRAPHGA